MTKFQKEYRLSGELPEDEIDDDLPSKQEIHDPFWEWALEEDEDEYCAQVTRVFIPFSR